MATVKGGKSGQLADKSIDPATGQRVFTMPDGRKLSDAQYKAEEGDYTEAATGPQGKYVTEGGTLSGPGATTYVPDHYGSATQEPTKAPSAMSPLEKAAFESKQRKAGTPTPVPSPIDDEEKKKKRNNNQLTALMGSDDSGS